MEKEVKTTEEELVMKIYAMDDEALEVSLAMCGLIVCGNERA